MSTQSSSLKRPVRPESPHLMWRQICSVSESLAVSGDLPSNRVQALEQLRIWEEAGITDVFDMREEANDTEFIHKNSSITSHWFGVDDDGGNHCSTGGEDVAYDHVDSYANHDDDGDTGRRR